jgi:peroxiredoxin
MLTIGDPAPHFKAASSVNAQFNFDTVAGRYVVISFFGSSRHPVSERFLTEIVNRGERFDVTSAIFFGVTTDPEDVERIKHQDPGRIYFYDLDLAVSRLYGVVGDAAASPRSDEGAGSTAVAAAPAIYSARTFVLDPALRVIAVIGLSDDAAGQVDAIFSVLDSMPRPAALAAAAPVLIVPYVFEPDLCKALINYYETTGGEDSGFMRDVNGKTVGLIDYSHKRRMDCEITNQDLIWTAHNRMRRRLLPAIRQAYQFDVTRIERNIVACYDAAQGAHFKAHRDNTSLGTAHRRFAVTINLNSPDYEGAEIRFPEFGPKLYKAPVGAAIVFSCSLLHEVPRVTRGKRYAYLPFLYDDAAAAIRDRNRKYLGDLSGAGGGNKKPADCNATPNHQQVTTPPAANAKIPVLDGTCGCGNPNGCGTCLSAATYPIGKAADRASGE